MTSNKLSWEEEYYQTVTKPANEKRESLAKEKFNAWKKGLEEQVEYSDITCPSCNGTSESSVILRDGRKVKVGLLCCSQAKCGLCSGYGKLPMDVLLRIRGE
jgi:hypothetical protein